MAKYGEVLDPTYDPDHENVYPLFVDYFENPMMTKMKNVNGYSMYMARNKTMLIVDFMYIIAFTPQDNLAVGTVIALSKLSWVSLQTRTLKEEYKLPYHVYTPRRYAPLDVKISLVRKTTDEYTYEVEGLPIVITLLPAPRGPEYNKNGSVCVALETYQTIVTFR